MRSTKPYLLLVFAASLCGLQLQAQKQVSGSKNLPLSNALNESFSSPGRMPVISKQARLASANQTSEFDYPVSDCFTYTFRLKTGPATGQTFLKETFRAQDDQVYTTGYVIASTTKKCGLIQLLNYDGNIAWSKTYAHPSRDITFRSIRQLSTGNLMVIGTSELSGGSDKKMIIMEADLNGNLQWSKTLSYSGYDGIGISPTTFNGIGIAGHDDSTVLYGKLDYSGNPMWLKKVRLMEKGAVVGLTKTDVNAWYIAYSGVDSSRHVSLVCHIDPVNGNIDWIGKLGGAAQNRDFIVHDLQESNVRPKVVGIVSEGGGAWQLFKATFNGANFVEDMHRFNVPGVVFDTTAFSSITPWAEAIVFSPSAGDPDIYSLKTINYTSGDTLLYWTKKFAGIGTHEVVNIERTFDGGFLIATNVSAGINSQGYLLKTDSTGWIKTCEGNDFMLFSTMYHNWPVTSISKITMNITSSIDNEVITVSNESLPSAYECKQLSCPDVPPVDSCVSSYNRTYRGATYCDLGLSLLLEEQDKIAIIGIMRDNPYDGMTDNSTLSHVDARGKLVDKKKMNIGHRGGFSKVIRMMDGNLLAFGGCSYSSSFNTFDTGYMTITKLTPAFGFIWNKSFPFSDAYAAIYSIIESQDGSIFLNYVEGTAFCEKISLMKLDSQGNLLWLKDYTEPNSCIFGYVGSMTQDQDDLYIMNWATGNPGMLFLKIRKTDGSVIWTKGYNIANADQVRFGQNLSFIGNDLVVQGTASGINSARDVVIVLDTNGTVKHSRFFQDANGYSTGFSMTVTQNHNVVLTGGGYNTNAFVRMDSTLAILNCKQVYSRPSRVTDVIEGLDGSIYSLGFTFAPNVYENDITLKKYTPDGLLGSCFADTLLLITGSQIIISSSLTANISNNNAVLSSLPFGEGSYSLQENKLFCSEVASCNNIDLTGPGGICDTLQYTIQTTRNPNCNAPIYFAYDNSMIHVVSRTDSTLIIKCVQSGSTMLRAKIFTGCVWVEDSIAINISLQMANLDLGPDTSICPSNTIVLNAHHGYVTYQWSDGSADSTLVINSPGTYYVNVSNACGVFSTDTISVSPASPIPFDIGPDRTKCNNDTIQLNAPGGFLNYTWGPPYNISSQSGQQVIVQPLVDTSYFVKAEKTAGCFAFDTIKVKVNTSPPILLGQDKSFCQGDSVLLNAGFGFTQYQWSNGNSSQQIAVHSTGSYSVIGITTEGCKSYDTLRIINVWPNPVVRLDDKPELCIGDTRVLNAGNFNAYLWQNGSTASSFVVSGQGTYYVIVWDNNQCKGNDTVRITTMLPTPANFLPADTAICNYGSLLIKPSSNYSTYSWSNNTVSSSITVVTPGTYWLQVKDANDCMGRDSILVNLKECLKGFYIPNAFTPDRNGRNDDFKPFIGGIIKQYQFTIYNRWGQIVFTTRELLKGWDGTVAGTQQDTNVFAWTCIYQLGGEEIKREKGTVVLIR